jgi:hypothetical protein
MSGTVDLSEEDVKRINNAEFYQHAKTIMKSFEEYQHVNVGEVYSILYKNHSDKLQYISRGRTKDKYMIVHKDDGFVFAKRIKSDGSLSKNVVCLTVRYPQPNYSVELDAEQAEAIIFQDEASFDPFKEGKDLAKKKNKARKINKSKIKVYSLVADALSFVSNLKTGDVLFDAGTAFGEGIVEWKVTSIEKRAVDVTPQTDWNGRVYAYGKTDTDQKSNKYSISTYVSVTLNMVGEAPVSRRWVGSKREINFIDFLNCNDRHRDWYVVRPTTIEEV